MNIDRLPSGYRYLSEDWVRIIMNVDGKPSGYCYLSKDWVRITRQSAGDALALYPSL